MLIEDRQKQANILAVVISATVLMLVLAITWGGSCAACNSLTAP